MESYFRANRLNSLAAAARGVVVGTHDGSRATLHVGSLDNAVVFHHESAHEAMFTMTIDGVILAVLWRAIDRKMPTEAIRRKSLRTTARTLMEASRFAQEVFATYYGIKMVEPEKGVAALTKLPEEYQTYFKAASDVIDPYYKSTFLQVRMITTLAHFAFRSLFAQRFLPDPWRAWKDLRDDEKPSWRLKTLFEDLTAGGAEKLRRAIDDCAIDFFARENIKPWSLDDEEPWLTHAIAAYQLDLALDQCIHEWLLSRSVLPTLEGPQRTESVAQLRNFASQLGETLEEAAPLASSDVANSDLDEVLKHFRGDTAARVRARAQASSVIANESVGSSFPGLIGRALWEVDDYAAADKLLVVASDPSGPSQTWTVVRFGPAGSATNFTLNGRHCHGARLARGDVVDWLNAMAEPAGAKWSGKVPDPIVVPFGREQLTGPRAWSLDGTQAPGCIDGRLNHHVAMYLMGNWIDVIEKVLTVGSVDLTDMYVEVGGYGGKPMPLTVKVARGNAIPGRCLIRAFGRDAGAMIDLLTRDWRANPACRWLPNKEAEEAGFDFDFVGRAFNGVLAFWSRF
jgi:hypothetical protein